jgi:hypothetical protein
MLDYTLTINGVNFTAMVERDSYRTAKIPVFSESVTTMDGVDHVALLRNKSSLTFEFNPQTTAQTKTAYDALTAQPCTVYFFNIQSNAYKTANMKLDEQSAQYLSRCLSRGLRWNQMDPITLTEL